MKKFLVLFFTAIVMFTALTPFVKAGEEQKNGRWFNPKMLKTYIPSGHKRTEMMKHAFARWTKLTNDKVIFRYVSSPDTANIVVHFVSVIPNADREIGLTRTRGLSNGKIIYAEVYIADKTAKGKVLGKDSVFTVMLHEIGHAIGIIQHSNDPKSIMYPVEDDIQEILPSDLKTLAEIYGW